MEWLSGQHVMGEWVDCGLNCCMKNREKYFNDFKMEQHRK